MSYIAIRAEGLGKYYKLHQPGRTLSAGMIQMARRIARPDRLLRRYLRGGITHSPATIPESTGIWALKDVAFEIERGEHVGVIGRNGAGKTTLLKILSRVIEPAEGRAEIHGRTSSLLSVGAGFHPDFTGRENVFLSGMLLGLKRKDIERHYDQIVDFAEIGQYIEAPVKVYSTGMRARLAFAIAVQLASDVMLLDEVLAVGDAGFRRKCLDLMREKVRGGRTIMLVSHNTGYIEEFCDRCLLIEKGRLIADGPSSEVIAYYLKAMFPEGEPEDLSEREDREGSGELRITEFFIEDSGGRRLNHPQSGQDCVLCLRYETRRGVVLHDIDVGIAFCDNQGRWLSRLSTYVTNSILSEVSGDGVFKCHIPRLPLTIGDYGLGFRIAAAGDVIDYVANAAKFTVAEGDFFGTGLQETHSPLLILHDWHNVTNEVREAIPIRK